MYTYFSGILFCWATRLSARSFDHGSVWGSGLESSNEVTLNSSYWRNTETGLNSGFGIVMVCPGLGCLQGFWDWTAVCVQTHASGTPSPPWLHNHLAAVEGTRLGGFGDA